MNNMSDRLDFFDKSMDLYNYYIENQKRNIVNDIRWIEKNAENPDELRLFFSKFFQMEYLQQLSDEDLQQMALIQGNYLFSQLQGLENKKVNNNPLKMIVQELKIFGK